MTKYHKLKYGKYVPNQKKKKVATLDNHNLYS